MTGIKIGTDGFIRVVDRLGDDTNIVNAARVSFGKSIQDIEEKDIKLLNYLATHNHTSPFRHVCVQFHIKAPEFVARQMYKHVVGSAYSFPDTAWNEASQRYIEIQNTHWNPSLFRKQSVNKKQGSDEEAIEQNAIALCIFEQAMKDSFSAYNRLLDLGVCKEQARTVLPLACHTEWYWTASLQAIHHFVKLRKDSHAQKEIQDYAIAMETLVRSLYPHAWEALLNG